MTEKIYLYTYLMKKYSLSAEDVDELTTDEIELLLAVEDANG